MGVVKTADIQKQMQADVERLKDLSKTWYATKPKTWGIPTGLEDIDRITGGLVRDEIVVLAGAPGSGKTSLGLQLTEAAAAVIQDQKLDMMNVVVSAEMPRPKLYMRSACRRATIDSERLRRGDVNPAQLDAFHAELDYLLGLPMLVVDRPGMTSVDVRNLVNMLMNDGVTIGVLCVDYVQRLADEGEDIARVSRIMQNLGIAKAESGCCMLAMSQYTREKEKEGRPPKLQDLFGGSRIENDADQVWALHHPDPQAKFTENPLLETQCHVLKNRNGRLGIIELIFHKTYTHFKSLPPKKAAKIA